MPSPTDAGDIVRRFEPLYTGAVTDALDELGFTKQTLDPAITPLQSGMKAAGRAFPVAGRPDEAVEHEDSIRTILEMLNDTSGDDVLLYDTQDTNNAHIGELTTTYLAANGCAGAVVDGGARDTEFIRDQGYPVFARYETPQDCVPRWELRDWDVRTTVGGVDVTPGDVILADSDGVVVVPNEVAREVVERAEACVDSENRVRDAVANGADPLEAFDEYGTF